MTHDPPLPPGWEATLEAARLPGEPVPSVGRIVHYVDTGGAQPCLAAIITGVLGGIQYALTIFNPDGSSSSALCEQGSSREDPGTWHWPERV